MAILVGIDEAGYGPILGPLVVTAVAFEVPDDAVDKCLWRLLKASITSDARKRDTRLAIADSKKLYKRREHLAAIERAVLVMAETADRSAPTSRLFLDRVAPHAWSDVSAYPWYRDFDIPLPSATTPADIAVRANAVRRNLLERGVRLITMACEPLMEGHFNRLVRNTRNKAVVSLGLVWRLVDRMLSQCPGRPVRFFVDRQGSRLRYGPSLMTAFDQYRLRVLSESADRSAYRLEHHAASHQIEFVTSGEDRHLPVALASLVSKYLRELFMRALNRYWTDRVEGLQPTAGYYQDGRRFLSDIEHVVRQEQTQRSMLVRSK